MKISPARVAAFDILKRIETERAFSAVLLPEYEAQLTPPDRSLCHELVLGVLRRQMTLDAEIDHFAGGKKLDHEVRISLRICLYQLKYLNKIPPHSAVNESVNLVQKAKKSSAKGFVNAVLRNIQRDPYRPRYKTEMERVVLETSHPKWLVEKWISQFGAEETFKLAVANNEPSSIAFRRTAKSAGISGFDGAAESVLVPGAFTTPRFTQEIADAAARNDIYLQDEGSQLVANLLDPAQGPSVLDVCAAPGSKITLAATRFDEKATLVAGDLRHHRTRFLLENCKRQGAGVSVVEYNAEDSLPFEEESFDQVLVDAPCSGTGTIRHNPEIRYFIESKDFMELSGKQRRILRNASKMVKRGGVLIYSTCSLETEENEAVAASFLAESTDFDSIAPAIDERFISPSGHGRTFPQRDNIDGFFIATFARVG